MTIATTGSVNQALLSGTINTGVKHQTGKGVSEHMVQSLNEPIDCSMTSSNELAEMFFDDYSNLDEMFTSVSNYYEEEFDTAVDNMSSLIEPIMIVFMGAMIGGLMIAMYSPIFNVGAIIGG